MAHFAYLTSPAARGGTTTQWPDQGQVYSEDFAWFAACAFKSINGDDGGTWAPGAAIIIGGSGLQISSSSAFLVAHSATIGTYGGSDQLTSNGTTWLRGVATFDAGAQFNASGNVTVLGNFTAVGDNITLGDSPADTLAVNAGTSFSAAVSCTDNFTVNGGSSGSHKAITIGQYVDVNSHGVWTHTGNALLQGATTIIQLSVPAGEAVLIDPELRANGGIRQPVQTITASTTVVTTGTRWVICNIAAGGYITLPSGQPINSMITIKNISTLSVAVHYPGGGTICQLQDATVMDADHPPPRADVYWDGSNWQIFDWFKLL